MFFPTNLHLIAKGMKLNTTKANNTRIKQHMQKIQLECRPMPT